MRPGALLAGVAVLLGGVMGGGGLEAQEGPPLLQRVSEAPDGPVRVVFPLRDDVRVCEGGNVRTGHRVAVGADDRWGWDEGCVRGVAEVVLEVRGGVVHRVGRPSPPVDGFRGTDLGRVAGPELAEALMALARTAPAATAEDALIPAVLARGATVWPGLLELAGNRERPEKLRRSALFWLGQEAGEVVTRGLVRVAEDGSESRKVRDAAVFALSQRPDAEAVPALMELIRESPDPEVRKKALFWLAQSKDPRVLPFFEEILRDG